MLPPEQSSSSNVNYEGVAHLSFNHTSQTSDEAYSYLTALYRKNSNVRMPHMWRPSSSKTVQARGNNNCMMNGTASVSANN